MHAISLAVANIEFSYKNYDITFPELKPTDDHFSFGSFREHERKWIRYTFFFSSNLNKRTESLKNVQSHPLERSLSLAKVS